MKKQFLLIEKLMKHGEVMCVNELSEVTGIPVIDVLKIISKNSLLFQLIAVPMNGNRQNSVYYKLNKRSVDYFRKNQEEARCFSRYMDIGLLV